MKMEMVACDIGNRCMQTSPCQHDCIITLANGTTHTQRLSGWHLVKDEYWKLLNDDDKSHFQKMQRRIQAEEDKSKYALFLQYRFID